MEEGYIVISRKLKESWLHPSLENRKYTRYEAWIWIIENARFACSDPVLLNGKLITIPRGYLSTTVEYLSKVFNWDKRKTEKFLQLLELDQKIRRFKINKKDKRSYTLIKVNNYNKYQLSVCDICTSKYKLKCNSYCASKEENKKKSKTKITSKDENNKKVYGSKNNVKLTDSEYSKLLEEYGQTALDKVIEYLSCYKVDKNYKNKDDNLTIRRWVLDACKITKKISNSTDENYGGF